MNIFNSSAFIIAFFIFLSAAVSCGLLNGDDDDIIAGREFIYEGVYTQGIEDTWFRPCIAGDESWLLHFNDKTYAPFRKAFNEGGWEPLFVKIKGTPSKKGEYRGWFVTHNREFEITKILDVRKAVSDDCNAAELIKPASATHPEPQYPSGAGWGRGFFPGRQV